MAQSSLSSSSEVLQAWARYVQAGATSAGVQFNEEMRWLCRVREALEHASAESLGHSPWCSTSRAPCATPSPMRTQPQHFALGPYHQSLADLKDMERYKLTAAKCAKQLFAGDHKIPDLIYRFPKSTRSNYFILLPHGDSQKINNPPMEKEALKQLLEEEDDLVEISGANFTPRKRRHVKVKEQLDDRFLRRSKRISGRTTGFKDAKSAQEAVAEPVPLAIIPAPGSTLAPHLTKVVVHGIAEGYLQIHPSVASASLLDKDVNDDKLM